MTMAESLIEQLRRTGQPVAVRVGGKRSGGKRRGCQKSPRRPRGLGDWLAAAIKWASRGRIKQRPGCGCAKRQEKLNRAGWRVNRLAHAALRLSGCALREAVSLFLSPIRRR